MDRPRARAATAAVAVFVRGLAAVVRVAKCLMVSFFPKQWIVGPSDGDLVVDVGGGFVAPADGAHRMLLLEVLGVALPPIPVAALTG